jgi:uncharacterized protein (DUF1499 family)
MRTDVSGRDGFSIAWICLIMISAVLLVSVMSGLGTNWQWWGFRTGLKLLRWTVYAEIFLAVIALAGVFLSLLRKRRKDLVLFTAALTICLATLIVPLRIWFLSKDLPAIHDITTDTETPPLFKAVIPLRKDAENPVTYGGKEIAELQQRFYPDIRPIVLEIPPSEAFAKSLSAANKLGWRIISADEKSGMIEATDSTFWFGFTDDIVIRIERSGKGSRVDVRSLSRVGKKDWGKNAERIRGFMEMNAKVN